MTVKRRFKTLMLRKKKRQSEREAEISQKHKMDHKEESEMKGTVSHEVLHINNPDTEGHQSQRQIEKPETSAGQIDLNCCWWEEPLVVALKHSEGIKHTVLLHKIRNLTITQNSQYTPSLSL